MNYKLILVTFSTYHTCYFVHSSGQLNISGKMVLETVVKCKCNFFLFSGGCQRIIVNSGRNNNSFFMLFQNVPRSLFKVHLDTVVQYLQ